MLEVSIIKYIWELIVFDNLADGYHLSELIH